MKYVTAKIMPAIPTMTATTIPITTGTFTVLVGAVVPVVLGEGEAEAGNWDTPPTRDVWEGLVGVNELAAGTELS